MSIVRPENEEIREVECHMSDSSGYWCDPYSTACAHLSRLAGFKPTCEEYT